MSITYTKLSNGQWGIRADMEDAARGLQPNQRVRVLKRDGTAKVETVDRVVLTHDGVQIAEIKTGRPKRRRRCGPLCAVCARPGELKLDYMDRRLKHPSCHGRTVDA